MMECPRVEELLERYLDGELSSRVEASVRGHLAGCETDRQRLQSLQNLRKLVQVELSAHLDEVDFSRLWPAVRRSIAVERQPGLMERLRLFFSELLTYRAPAVAAVAAAAVALAVVIPLLPFIGTDSIPGDDIEIMALETMGTVTVWPVETEDGDSTIIWIDDSDETDGYDDGIEPTPAPTPLPEEPGGIE